jgi:hypothetical protein
VSALFNHIKHWSPARKAIVSLIFGFSLIIILLISPKPPSSANNPSMKTNEITSPNFDSPEQALETLLAAYQSQDIEAIVAAKDFALDSQLFWEGIGLPINEKQQTNSVAAFETNFRKQLSADGIPDYHGLKYSLVRHIQSQSNFVILILEGQLPDGRTLRLNLPTILTGKQWKAIQVPGYDHL